jgi:hypothetical protein
MMWRNTKRKTFLQTTPDFLAFMKMYRHEMAGEDWAFNDPPFLENNRTWK